MRTRVTAGLVAVLAVLPAGGVAAAANGTRWSVAPPVPLPVTATGSTLEDVTLLSATEAWAVGAWTDTESHPLAVHWNGTAWAGAPVAVAVGSAEVYQLNAVDGVAPDQVWAVGAAESADGADVAVALRYDGLAWRPLGAPLGAASELSDVDMLTADDGWAVGSASTQPLILRWHEGHWTPVPVPVSATEASLSSVVAAAPDDVWAVGSRRVDGGRRTALVLHWNGDTWAEVAPPDLGRDDSLVSVAGGAASAVWAAGSTCDPVDRTRCTPLVLRWSAGGWQAVPAQYDAVVVSEVVVLGSGKVWLIGHIATAQLPQVDHAEYWDGRRFVTDETLLAVLPPVSGSGKPASALTLAAAAADKASNVLCAVGWSQGPPIAPHALFRT